VASESGRCPPGPTRDSEARGRTPATGRPAGSWSGLESPTSNGESEPDLRARRGQVPLARVPVGAPRWHRDFDRAFIEATDIMMAASSGSRRTRADEPNLKSQGELRFRCHLLVEADTVRSTRSHRVLTDRGRSGPRGTCHDWLAAATKTI
jgi:hypothetical protein